MQGRSHRNLASRKRLVGAAACLLALAGVGLLVWRSPVVTLDYVRTMRWPLVVAGIAWYFRRPITSLLLRLQHAVVKTPFGEFEFAGQEREGAVWDDTELAREQVEKYRELIEARVDTVAESDQTEVEDLYEQLALRDLQIEFERLLNSVFDSQLDFLRFLRAPAGMATTARSLVEEFYERKTLEYPVLVGQNVDAFLSFLLTNQLFNMTFDGQQLQYSLSEKGDAFLTYADSVFHVHKLL